MVSRRRFIQMSAAGLAAGISAPALARMAPAGERRLAFYNLHTGEHLKATYWADGQYIDAELQAVNKLLRDHRSGEMTDMDPGLLDQLYQLQSKVGGHRNFVVISGYRSPKTNAWLRKHSSGVAKRSLHMQGRAIDLRLPGTDLKYLRKAALAMHAGGVGYYPQSNFVHIDTGRPRFW